MKHFTHLCIFGKIYVTYESAHFYCVLIYILQICTHSKCKMQVWVHCWLSRWVTHRLNQSGVMAGHQTPARTFNSESINQRAGDWSQQLISLYNSIYSAPPSCPTPCTIRHHACRSSSPLRQVGGGQINHFWASFISVRSASDILMGINWDQLSVWTHDLKLKVR